MIRRATTPRVRGENDWQTEKGKEGTEERYLTIEKKGDKRKRERENR